MPFGAAGRLSIRAVLIRLGLVLLALLGLMGVGLRQLWPLGHASTGVLASDHEVGPLGPASSLGQTFTVRYAGLDRVALHLLRMRDDATGTVELDLIDNRTGTVLAQRSVDVVDIPATGAFIELLSQPVRVDPADELEVRVVVPASEQGGIGSAARSGNPYVGGRAVRDGVAFESDLLFVAESTGDLSAAAAWAVDRIVHVSGYGRSTLVVVAAAGLALVASLASVLFVLISWPGLRASPDDPKPS